MARYNVQRPQDGYWACFSAVVDDYITDFMPEDQYQAWREKEYGNQAGPLTEASKMTYEEAAAEYELRRTTKLGRLIANREVPVLMRAKRILDASSRNRK